MHGLCCAEILRLARCSRLLLSAADSTFAWSHAPPLPLQSFLLTAESLRMQVSPLLRRNATFSLDWLEGLAVLASDIDVLLACSDVVRISELHMQTNAALTPAGWDQIVKHPSIQQNLRVVSIQTPTADAVHAVSKLPLLHTLRLDRPLILPPCPDICLMPSALTSLSVHDQPDLSIQPMILLCAELRHLSIATPHLPSAESWAALFMTRQLASLRSLTLHPIKIPANSNTTVVFIRVFESLCHLERLELSVSGFPSRVLNALSAAVALRHLEITPSGKCNLTESHMLALMLACPRLRCTVRLSMPCAVPRHIGPMVERVAAHELVQERIQYREDLKGADWIVA